MPGYASTTQSAPAVPAQRATTESVLLVRAGKGDQSAFAAFYDLLARRVYGVAVRLVGVETLAEDVVQEVFVEVWRNAPRFDPSRGSAATWTLMITRRRAIDRIRSEQAARDREQREACLQGTAVHDQVNDHIATADVREALQSLPERQREAVVLAFFGGHTHREVALLLGAPLGTVKSRIRDGLFRLREVLEVGA